MFLLDGDVFLLGTAIFQKRVNFFGILLLLKQEK